MSAAEHVTVSEIADLTAWMRRLSQAGLDRVDPAEFAEFHAAKARLLARIDDQRTHASSLPDSGKDTP